MSQGKIIGLNGKPFILKGVNLGGWLLMEGYILHSLNVGESVFKKEFLKTLGKEDLTRFEKNFRETFIQEEDFQKIARLGFNCIRLPFHYKLIEKKPYRYSSEGLVYLDKTIAWAKKYNLLIILDLHAAAGCQNHDWHSDSVGQAQLWSNPQYQNRTAALWKFLANRYRDCSQIAGYDILNESVVSNARKLNCLYRKIFKAIRSVDPNHIIFLEGNLWATNIACLDNFRDSNHALSIHFYHPIDFTFNFVPELLYPLRLVWNKKVIQKMVRAYAQEARKRQIPLLVGEFGINYRYNRYGEVDWLKDLLEIFDRQRLHWTYWTYKAVKNAHFPDGMFSFYPNTPWVNRPGPRTGWATYAHLWPKRHREIVESWKTRYFQPNQKVLSVLQHAAAQRD